MIKLSNTTKTKKEKIDVKLIQHDIDKLQISNRTKNALKRNGIFTREQLYKLTDSDLLNLPSIWNNTLDDIKQAIEVDKCQHLY